MTQVVLFHSAQGLRPDVEALADLPAEVHYAVGDALVTKSEVEQLEALARSASAPIEVHTYPGSGHLFADPDGPAYDRASAGRMLERQLALLDARMAAS
jgi:dienelactone hydrolase